MDLHAELSSKKIYRVVFDDLRRKARAEPHRLDSRPVNRSFSLAWLLRVEPEITAWLIKEVRAQCYHPGRSSCSFVQADKRRLLYALAWPDRVCEAALARLIGRAVEPQLSPRLFSFRKGMSNFMAVRDFAAFMAGAAQSGQAVYAVRRDVAQYGETIQVPILLEQLRQILGEQDPYFWALLEEFTQPICHGKDGAEQRLALGLPAGFCLTPICENVYLRELDQQLDCQAGLFYSRFGDDILAAHADPEEALQAAAAIDETAMRLGLTFGEDKSLQVVLGQGAHAEFRQRTSLDYLGFNIDCAGRIFLSQRKVKALQAELRRTARYAFLANRREQKDPAELSRAIIQSLNLYYKRELQHPYFGLMLATVTNSERLRHLDKWVAKLPLRYLYRTGHDRVFRRASFQSVRAQGLLSLVHLRNVAWRRR